MLCAVQDEWAPVLDHPARDRASASNRLALIEFEAQLAVGGVDRQCRRVGTRQQEDHAARRYHFLEHIRDRREQRLAVEMTSDGAVNFEERRELIGPQVRRPVGSRLKLVGGLLDGGASLRSPTQRRISTRVGREITKHAACTYRQVPWVPSRLGIAVARPFGTPPIPRGHVTVNSPPLALFVAGRLGGSELAPLADRSPWTGTITCVRARTCGADWDQPRQSRD